MKTAASRRDMAVTAAMADSKTTPTTIVINAAAAATAGAARPPPLPPWQRHPHGGRATPERPVRPPAGEGGGSPLPMAAGGHPRQGQAGQSLGTLTHLPPLSECSAPPPITTALRWKKAWLGVG